MKQYLPLVVDGTQKIGLELTDQQCDQLLEHLIWVQKWNKAYNLTAITQSHDMVVAHTLDSLAALPYIDGLCLLDMGTGAGFPGLPIAIACPDRQVCLLDGNGKRTRFLLQLVHHLGLKNVTVAHSRVENYRSEQAFDGIMSRAVAKIDTMIAQSQHLLAEQGHYYWLKGQKPEQELHELSMPYHVQILQVPGMDKERHLIVVDG